MGLEKVREEASRLYGKLYTATHSRPDHCRHAQLNLVTPCGQNCLASDCITTEIAAALNAASYENLMQLLCVHVQCLLCLGGRSHEAYSSSFVYGCVIPSVNGIAHCSLEIKR